MKKLKQLTMMHIGIVLLAIGVYFFKIPNGFSTGGVTGVGTILAAVTHISATLWIWILNIGLLVLGFIFLGKETGAKTVYCSMAYSILMIIFEKVIPLTQPLSEQPFLELFYAMLLTSVGSAFIFNSEASSGGTDIAALILKKFTSIDVGKALLCVDFIVATSAFFVFGIETGLFSFLGLFAKAFIVDAVIENLNTCKYFVVITSKPKEISEYIMKTIHHGVTAHKVVGEYTGEERGMLHTVCKRMEAVKLRNEIRKIDVHAFTIITTSSEIIGRGFRSV